MGVWLQMTQDRCNITMQDRGMVSMGHPAADLMVTLSMTSRDPKWWQYNAVV